MSSEIHVRRVTTVPPERDEIARADGSPWHGSAWARLYARFGVRELCLLAERDGRAVGTLTVLLQGSRRVPRLDRIFGCRAVVFDEPAAVDPGAVAPLLDAAEREARRAKAVEIEVRVQRPRRLPAKELEGRGYRVRVEGAGIRELPAPEHLDASFSRLARRQAKKATAAGVAVEADEGVSRLLPLLDRSFERSGLSARDPAFVAALLDAFPGEVLVAVREGTDLAALLWVRDGEVAINVFTGRADGEIFGASHLLHREMLRRAIAAGVRTVHTGGMALPGDRDGKAEGIARFKASLGFRAEPGLRAVKVLRPIRRRIRAAASGGWNWLRGGGR